MPNAAHFVDGVVFSRGAGGAGGQPARALRVRERALRSATRLLVVHAGGRSVGLVVDAAREFVSIDPASIQPPGDGADRAERPLSRRGRQHRRSARFSCSNLAEVAARSTIRVLDTHCTRRGSPWQLAKSNGRASRASLRAFDTRLVLTQAEQVTDDRRRDRAHHRRGLGGRGRAGARARPRRSAASPRWRRR